MPINSLYDASNLSIEKSLVNFSIPNEMLQKLDQPDKTEFSLCDEGIDVGDVVRDDQSGDWYVGEIGNSLEAVDEGLFEVRSDVHI